MIVSHDERRRKVADRVLWLEDGLLKALDALVCDPVCGMLLDPTQAPGKLERAGGTMVLLLARLSGKVEPLR